MARLGPLARKTPSRPAAPGRRPPLRRQRTLRAANDNAAPLVERLRMPAIIAFAAIAGGCLVLVLAR